MHSGARTGLKSPNLWVPNLELLRVTLDLDLENPSRKEVRDFKTRIPVHSLHTHRHKHTHIYIYILYVCIHIYVKTNVYKKSSLSGTDRKAKLESIGQKCVDT